MNKKGFTLLELAIVLIIVGVLSAGAMKILFGAFNNNKQTATRNNIALIVKDIAAYTVKGRRLPATLDRATSQTNDTFGRALVYAAAENLEDTDICSVQTTDMSINGAVTENNIAFLVISTGEDGQQQYTKSDNTYTFNNGNDDVVGWMNLGTLQAMAGCDGSLSIEQNKLPDAIVSNTYSFKLTPKGGTSPYKWCVESDNSATVKNQMYFGINNSDKTHSMKNIGDCTSANGVTNDTITLHSDTKQLSIAESDSGSALIKVRLEDANGITITKNFDLRILRNFEVAMEAPTGGEPPSGGFSDFQSNKGETVSTQGNPDTASVIINENELKIVQNNGDSSTSVFSSCSPDITNSNACPKFENHGKFAAYFVYNYTHNPNDTWGYPRPAFGFTFAVIKSYYNDSNNVKKTTLGLVGDAGPQLGYGSMGEQYLNWGNSFAVEFDLQNDQSGDPNNNHLGIISNVDVIDWSSYNSSHPKYDSTEGYRVYSPWQKYKIFPRTIHGNYGDTADYWSHNQSCGGSKVTGRGCYYDSSTEMIPNNYDKTTPSLYGLRVEAVSGCNYKCTDCNKQTGINNYIFINVWRKDENSINNSADLKKEMQDVTLNHTYDYVTQPSSTRHYPTTVGNPLMSSCIPDDTTSTGRTLDTIRVGFTSGKWGSSNATYIEYIITNFRSSVTQY